MRFQVPQFIDIEDKIFGPLTFKQFVYIIGGAAISFIIYRVLPLYLALIFIAPLMGFSIALAFLKVNNRPFVFILEAAIRHSFKKKLYTWKKEPRKVKKIKEDAITNKSLVSVPHLSENKLKDIAWSLDVHESIYTGQKKNNEQSTKP